MKSARIEVGIGEFQTIDIVDELFDRRIITRAERDALRQRKGRVNEDDALNVLAAHESDLRLAALRAEAIEDAKWNAARRNAKESLHCIVRAFPELYILESLATQ